MKINSRIVSVIILLSYTVLLVMTVSFSKESPISIWPYPQYFGVQSPEPDRGKVLSREDNAKTMPIQIQDDKIIGFSYSIDQTSTHFNHSNNYPFSTLSATIVKNLLEQFKLSDQTVNTATITTFVFFISPLLMFYLTTFLIFNYIFRHDDQFFSIRFLIIFTSIALLGIFRILFKFGYPESFIGTLEPKTFFDWIKGIFGPLLAAQGHAGLWGIEPRNISLMFGVVGLIFLISNRPEMIRFGLVYILLSLIVSISQGLLFILPYLYILFKNKGRRTIRYLILLSFIFLISLIVANYFVLFKALHFIILLILIIIILLKCKELNYFSKEDFYIMFFFLLLIYLVILLLTSRQNYLDSIDNLFLDLASFYNLENDYKLWGRGFLQEFPGRSGPIILLLSVISIFEISRNFVRFDFFRIYLNNFGMQKNADKSYLAVLVVIFFLFAAFSVWSRITEMLIYS